MEPFPSVVKIRESKCEKGIHGHTLFSDARKYHKSLHSGARSVAETPP